MCAIDSLHGWGGPIIPLHLKQQSCIVTLAIMYIPSYLCMYFKVQLYICECLLSCHAVTDLTEKPKVLDTSGSAIFGSPGVLCIRGATPGLNQDSTTWEKDEVTTAIAQNISDECPMCTECTPEVFLSLPSVQERLLAGYSHSSFVISTSSEVVGDRDYSECLTIKNRYISFLVIREVKEEDVGVWTLTVVSAHNAANTGAYNLGACKIHMHVRN